jgi:hypothetical protein
MNHEQQIARARSLYVHAATLGEQDRLRGYEAALSKWAAKPMAHDPAKKARVLKSWQTTVEGAREDLEKARAMSAQIFDDVIEGKIEPT